MIVWFEWWRPAWASWTDIDFNLNLLLNRSQKVILFGDVPPNPIPPFKATEGLLKAWVLNQAKKQGSFTFLNNLSEPDLGKDMRLSSEALLRRAVSNESWHGRVKYVPVESYFIHNETKKLMMLDPCKGTLVYRDFGHLNVDGARRVEPLFRREIFGQSNCKS